MDRNAGRVGSIVRAAGPVLALAASVILISSPGYAQTRSPSLWPVVGPQDGDPSLLAVQNQNQDQNQKASDSQPSARPPTPAANSAKDDHDKNRLTVNPVTGLVTSAGANYEPLTAHERWQVYWKMNYDSLGAYFGPVVYAAVLDQSTDSPPQWGPGAGGYGLRLASRTVGGMIQGSFQAPLAALLHEDVRYIAASRPGFRHRALHAIEYSFLTYSSQGHPTLNVANLSAYYASTAISSTWLPGKRSLPGYTFSNGSEQIALSLPVNLLQEFWPDVTRIILRRHPA